MATAETIELVNVGAIKQASLPYLPEGGVVELRGPQGVGKSTALEAIQAAATGKGKPPLRDRAAKGEIKAFGVTMKLGGRTTRSGEPEVTSIEGKLSVADIVDPGIQDPAAADAKRIKALVQLAGGSADPHLFESLFGGDETLFTSIVMCDVFEKTDDLTAIADKVKRDCEKAARDEEKAADSASGRAAALKQTAEGIDTTSECDSAKLQADLEAAIRNESDVAAAVKAAEKAARDRSEAIKAMEDAEANSQLPSMVDAMAAREKAAKEVAKLSQTVEKLTKQLIAAKGELADAERSLDNSESQIRSVSEFDKAMEAWNAVVESTNSVTIIDEELPRLAAQRVASARNAMEAGVAARKAIANLASAKEAEAEAETHSKAAAILRTVAKKTDDVLSAQVAKLGTPLRVEDGRLLIDTERGPTFFGELSDGQRWKLALEVAIDAVGERGLIVIPQWAWGELQPANKRAIAERLKERCVLAYTAVATDGEGIEASMYE